jgi:hypothetical protein
MADDWSIDSSSSASASASASFDALKAVLDSEAKSEAAAFEKVPEPPELKWKKGKRQIKSADPDGGKVVKPRKAQTTRRARTAVTGASPNTSVSLVKNMETKKVVPLSHSPSSPLAPLPSSPSSRLSRPPASSGKLVIQKRDAQGFRLCVREGCTRRIQKQDWIELILCAQCIGVRYCHWSGCKSPAVSGLTRCANCMRATSEQPVVCVSGGDPPEWGGKSYHPTGISGPGRLVISFSIGNEEDKEHAVDKLACGGIDAERNRLRKELRRRSEQYGKKR